MFTRKHYKKVAEVVNDMRTAHESEQVQDGVNMAREYAAKKFADMFQADNENFNRDRFLRACEVTE